MFHRVSIAMSGALVLLALVATPTLAMPPSPPGKDRFWDGYWQGLMSLREGQWASAAEAFSRASQLEPGDGRPLLARGMVRAITGEFAPAREDLTRARFLKSREPSLWQYAVDAMSGTSSGDRGIPIPRSLQKAGQPTSVFSGVPGHLIQGGKDYTTAYASAVFYELAMPYRSAREAGRPIDSPVLNAARRKVGRWFANRMLATPEMTSRNFLETKRLVQVGKYAEARELLDMARTAHPVDADMAVVSGDIWLKVGRPVTARKDYTIAATLDTALAAAYAGRAEAAAMVGDARTAQADLAHARRYGSSLPAGLEGRIEQLLAGGQVAGDPVALLAEMDRAALAGASVEKLVPMATRLHRAAAGRFSRYDELYQDTLRRLEDAVRADSSAVRPRVELAQYLHDEANLRGEKVEPRRGLEPFRWQYTKQMELNRALEVVDQALRIDPKDVPALVTRAYVLTASNRGEEARRSIDQAQALAGTSNPEAIRLLARFRKKQISRMFAAAHALRTPTFSTTTSYENRYDGVWRTTRTTRYDPSKADLARAAALEQQARALIEETKKLMGSAIAVSKGTLDGLLLESAYEDWFGSRGEALKLLERAAQSYPKSLEAHDALIAYLRFLGKEEAAIRQEAVSWQLFHTTCAPLLGLTWKNIQKQGWAAMLEDLDKARQLCPTDARATAYQALARNAARENKAALAMLRVGAALEVARIALDDQGIARRWPRPADDLANAMQLRQDLATVLHNSGQLEEATINHVASGDLALRYPPDGVAALMFGAMRPNPDASEVPAPGPVNGATLAARAHLGAARVLQAQGRRDDATKYLEAAARNVRSHDSMVPNIGTGGRDSNFGGYAEGASATALIELAKNAIARKQYQEAFRKLQDATQAKPTRAERQEINELIKQMLPVLNAQARQMAQPGGAATPSRAGKLIEAAKEQIRSGNYRAANLSLNRAGQSQPTPQERREIEQLLEEIQRREG